MRASTALKLGVAAAGAGFAAVQIAHEVIRRHENLDPDSVERPGAMFYLRGLGLRGGDHERGHRPVRTSATIGAIARSALPRWEIASFSSGGSSAEVRPSGVSSATKSTS